LFVSRRPWLAALACVLVLFSAGAHGAGAFGIYPAGTSGIDISYPACADELPAAPMSFAIIGVNGGRPFYQNPCLIKEFAWAQRAAVAPSFFMNLSSPVGSIAFKANSGPRGTCAQNDDFCRSYNFGYNAARLALADAQSQETAASMWWLDVETENTWSDNLPANAQVVQGAIDYLKSQSKTVGIYSTPKQWGEIAGAFSPGLPNWTAGAPDSQTAPEYCSPAHAFGGGTVWLVQYELTDFDADFACGAAPVAGGVPTSFLATAPNPTTIQLTWTPPAGSVDSYVISNGVTLLATVKAPMASFTVTGLAPSSYHCYTISALTGGVYSPWSNYACVTTPAR
jgi:hypothetical protein